MAWALTIAGTGQRINLGAAYTMQIGDTIEYIGQFRDSNKTFQMFLDFYSGGGNYVAIGNSGNDLFSRIAAVINSAPINLTNDDVFTYSLEKTATQYITSINGVELFRHTTTDTMTLAAFGDENFHFEGQFRRCTINNGDSVHDWSADSSDRSGSTAQPILTDTIGGNDATGVNFPAFDPSVWVFTGTPSTPSPWWLFQEED